MFSIEKVKKAKKVSIEINAPATVTAVITKKAIDDLGLRIGNKVHAIVKTTEIKIRK